MVKPRNRSLITEDQQALLDGVRVRLMEPGERARFDRLIVEEHYLGNAQWVGEQLRYVAEYQGQWVALMSWRAAAYKLKLREEWIGWSDQQKQRRLPLVVNNSRFLILQDFQVPDLASRVMRLGLPRRSSDWEQAYHHGVLMAESFVGPQLFLGTCYKVSGWALLGQTRGYGRCRQDFYQPHERPRALWGRELCPGARTILRGRNLPEPLPAGEPTPPPECPQSAEELRQMMRFFEGLGDWRSRKPDFRLSSLVTVTVCALLCKVCLGQRDLAAFAANLTREQREALRFPRDWSSRQRRYRSPSESTFSGGSPSSTIRSSSRLCWSGKSTGWASVIPKAITSPSMARSCSTVRAWRWSAPIQLETAVGWGPNRWPKDPTKSPPPSNGSAGRRSQARWSPPPPGLLRPPRPGSWGKTQAPISSSPSKAISPASPKTCNSAIKALRTVFPPQAKRPIAQTCELNRSRTEARCLIPFDTTATAANFPFVEQAARLTRCIDSRRHPAQGIETEYLLCSRPAAQMNAEQMLQADRQYWDIETGLHLRLDVIAGEDRSRVRHRTFALNLAVIRRAVVSVAVYWMKRCRN